MKIFFLALDGRDINHSSDRDWKNQSFIYNSIGGFLKNSKEAFYGIDKKVDIEIIIFGALGILLFIFLSTEHRFNKSPAKFTNKCWLIISILVVICYNKYKSTTEKFCDGFVDIIKSNQRSIKYSQILRVFYIYLIIIIGIWFVCWFICNVLKFIFLFVVIFCLYLVIVGDFSGTELFKIKWNDEKKRTEGIEIGNGASRPPLILAIEYNALDFPISVKRGIQYGVNELLVTKLKKRKSHRAFITLKKICFFVKNTWKQTKEIYKGTRGMAEMMLMMFEMKQKSSLIPGGYDEDFDG